jgi:hypothetical protein
MFFGVPILYYPRRGVVPALFFASLRIRDCLSKATPLKEALRQPAGRSNNHVDDRGNYEGNTEEPHGRGRAGPGALLVVVAGGFWQGRWRIEAGTETRFAEG